MRKRFWVIDLGIETKKSMRGPVHPRHPEPSSGKPTNSEGLTPSPRVGNDQDSPGTGHLRHEQPDAEPCAIVRGAPASLGGVRRCPGGYVPRCVTGGEGGRVMLKHARGGGG